MYSVHALRANASLNEEGGIDCPVEGAMMSAGFRFCDTALTCLMCSGHGRSIVELRTARATDFVDVSTAQYGLGLGRCNSRPVSLLLHAQTVQDGHAHCRTTIRDKIYDCYATLMPSHIRARTPVGAMGLVTAFVVPSCIRAFPSPPHSPHLPKHPPTIPPLPFPP